MTIRSTVKDASTYLCARRCEPSDRAIVAQRVELSSVAAVSARTPLLVQACAKYWLAVGGSRRVMRGRRRETIMTLRLNLARVTSIAIDGVDRCRMLRNLAGIDRVNCAGLTRLGTTLHPLNDMGPTD